MFFSQEIAGFTKGFLISTWFGLLIGWIYPPPPKTGCQSATRMMKSFLLGQVRESQLTKLKPSFGTIFHASVVVGG